jgi:hypothetical protein
MGHQQFDLLQYLTTIKRVEDDTGITFLGGLESGMRSVIESDQARGLW